MFLQNKTCLLLFCIAISLFGCTSNRGPSTGPIIVSPVTIGAGDTATLTVVTSDPDGDPLAIYWAASRGTVPGGATGPTVTYKAPSSGGLDTITVTITDGKETVNNQVKISIEEVNTPSPTSDPTIEPLPVPTVTDFPEFPIQTPSSVETTTPFMPVPQQLTISITEVMANPCGVDPISDANDATWNEYIELYNYGTEPIDVEGWWITDGESVEGNPDHIVSWGTRHSESSFGANVVTGSTIIRAGEFAVLLSPAYENREGPYRMPYIFPPGTVLLTVKTGSHLGSDDNGIEVSQTLNTLALYIGSEAIVEKVISTYGTPEITGIPGTITNTNNDGIPFSLRDCVSAERINPSKQDTKENWRQMQNGTPGSGDYGGKNQ